MPSRPASIPMITAILIALTCTGCGSPAPDKVRPAPISPPSATAPGPVMAATTSIRPAAVLFTGHFYHTGVGHEFARQLQQEGFAVNASTHYDCLGNEALTWERVRRYNVIVLKGLDAASPDGTLSDKNRTNLAILRRFLDEGGGILFTPVWCQQDNMLPTQREFLGGLGLTPLFDEKITDPDSRTIATTWKLPFALATVEPIPGTAVAAGVSRLWYPEATNAGAQVHTVPLAADAAWTALVRGARTASSRTLPHGENADPAKVSAAPVGTYPNAPLLAASRQVGKGRIVVLGITPEYLIDEPATRALDRVVYDKGLKGVKSDGAALVVNALRWLAEPSATSGDLGGAKMDPAWTADPWKTTFCRPWDWSKPAPAPADPLQQPGVVGARTAYSTGIGTVADWVAAAKREKLAFIVFLEEFAALTPAKLEALKQDCRTATRDGFTAIPGFTIDDLIGNHYFWCGKDLPWPRAACLDADGKRFGSPTRLGTVSGATLDYFHTQAGGLLIGGNYLYTQDAAPHTDWFSDWCAAAVVTCRDGAQVEDITADYLKLARSGQGPVPMALNLVTDPARLASSPWRTVVTLPATPVPAVPKDIATLFSQWHNYPDNPTSVYVTNGPRILNWSFSGPRDYDGPNQGDFVWQNLRWQVHGKAAAEAGLAEVQVWDGDILMRTFRPTGEREFAFTLDLTHDRQHNLVMIVTDRAGGKAISGDQWDRNHRLEEFMCGDRHNQLTYGYSTASDGMGVLLGGNQTLATPNKRVAGAAISPSGTFKNDKIIGSLAFDGAAGGEPEFFGSPMLRIKDGAKIVNRGAPTACESRRLLHTGDVNIGESLWEHRFTDDIVVTNVWGTLWRTEPEQDFTVAFRQHFFQIDPDSPLAVFLWRMDVALRRDLPNAGLDVGLLATKDARLWAIRSAAGDMLSGNWEDSRSSAGRGLEVGFAPGSYAAALDSPLGGCAVFPLSPGMRCGTHLPQNRRITISLDPAAAPQKQGETVRYEMLLVGIPRNTPRTARLPCNTTEVVERFRTDYGLGGQPAAYRVEAAAGTVIAATYPLRIDGAAQQGFSGRIAGKLASSLPIIVSGLNDRWSAVLYDRSAKKARPLGMFEGAAWATVPQRGANDLFIGHPVTADQPGLAIQVTQSGDSAWTVEVHNPTGRPVTATLKANPSFDPFTAKTLPAMPVEIAAGASLRLAL